MPLALIEIAGVVPPEDATGEVPVTLVTQVAQAIAPAPEIVTGLVPLSPALPTLAIGIPVGKSPVAIARNAGAPAVANKA